MNRYDAFLIKYAEIGIKGKNRHIFEEALVRQIKIALRPCEGSFSVLRTYGRVFVEARSDYDFEEVTEALSHVFGIWGICPVAVHELMPLEDLCGTAAAFMRSEYPAGAGAPEGSGRTFKVRTRRMNKEYPQDSLEVNAEVGHAVLEACPDMKVDVHTPEITLSIEIREKIYIYSQVIPGPGGLPVGVGGKCMLLLSGGIDSAVAGWMIAKRGVQINAVHFHSYPYTSDRAKEKVLDLARKLSFSCCGIKVHVVPFTEIQMQIHEKCPDEYTTLIMRRYMMRIAERIARETESEALVTGESIGQVASQTMTALGTTDAVVQMPVFRPLIGFDKSEIIAIARKIGTLEISEQPFEDCCTVFTPRHPATHPKMDKILEGESHLDEEALIQRALEGTEVIRV
jgi:thiamine biosynthesis protein ThiI